MVSTSKFEGDKMKMKLITGITLTLFLATMLSITFHSPQIVAEPMEMSNSLAGDLATAMGVDPADLINAAFSVDEIAGAVVYGSVGFLAPTERDTFVMMSSGNAQPLAFPDGWVGTPDDFLNVTNGNPSGTGSLGEKAHDIATLNLTLRAPDWAKSFSFNFRFMSEEYPYYVGHEYNDFFSCLLDGTNIAFDTEGKIINVNNTFFDPAIKPEGTVFNGTTVLLTSKAPVTGGATFELDFIVGDVFDDWYDTAVFLDNFRFSTEEVEDPVTGPTIWSSDSMENEKNTFAPTETVYVTVPATGKNVTFYIVADKDVWNDGDPLTDVSDGAEQLTLDPGPGLQVVQVWRPPLTLGSYDIVEDTNNNELYDAGVDGIDSVAEVGFVVEYTQITEYKAGFFTLGDIILFSYQDGLSVSIYDSSGTLLTTQSLDKGEHYFYHPGVGVYYAIGNKAFSVLIGDPITNNVVGYFAANASYYGVANEFYTYVSSDQDVIAFAYKSGTTNVTVEEWDGSMWVALSTFSLTGPGDHYRVPATAWSDKWLHFTSNQPISVQSYSDRCFFVPDESGLWSGTHFYLFAGWREDTQPPGGDNLHIHSYKDSNIVTVKYIGGSTIWTGTLNDGEWVNIDRDTIGTSQYIEVISTDTVTVSDEPWATFDYYGLLTVPDQSGTGVGTKFYTYARQSPPDGVGSIWVFAYNDGTNVEIKDMTAGSTILWTGTLNSNEYSQFVPPSGIGGHLFGIFSDNVVSVVEGTGGWGAEFVPLYSAAEVVLPKIIIDTPTDGEIIPTSDVTMTYHSPDPDIAYFEVRVDTGPRVNNSLATNFTFTGLSDGPHTLEVRAINTAGIVGIPDTVTITITVEYAPPVASFTYSPLTPYTGETVTFNASESYDPDGNIVSYAWDFGDGTNGTGQITTHTYANDGTYTVTLNVTDNDDLSNITSADVTVLNTPPVAIFTESSETAFAGEIIYFNASNSYDPDGFAVSYFWDFGDETTGTGITATHTYTEPGTYIITLTVKDEAGNSDTDSVIITVERDTDGDGTSDIADTDDDNDGIPDVWEIDNGLDPLDAQDAFLDPDNDGLINLQEYLKNRDPNVYDDEPIREPRSIYIVAQVAVVGAAVTAITAALASLGGLGQTFNSAVSKLPIPDGLKDFLKLYSEKTFETIDKAKIEALEKAAFITKGELAALAISALVMTIVFGFVEANGLPRFLNPSILAAVIPSTLLSVCIVSIVGELAEALCARTCRVYRQFRLWMYGLGVFLISGLLFLFPFASPGITRYQSGEISDKTKGLVVLSKMLVLLTLTIPFAGLFMLGFEIIGDAGLLLTLMTVCYSLVPLKPIAGKAVFDYRKEVSLIALVSTAILLYSFTVNLLPHVTYLAVGVASVFLAAITLSQLRKAHPK